MSLTQWLVRACHAESLPDARRHQTRERRTSGICPSRHAPARIAGCADPDDANRRRPARTSTMRPPTFRFISLLLSLFHLSHSGLVRADERQPATAPPKGEITKYT